MSEYPNCFKRDGAQKNGYQPMSRFHDCLASTPDHPPRLTSSCEEVDDKVFDVDIVEVLT